MIKAIKSHPIATFYILAFALSWYIKIPVSISDTDNVLFRLLSSFFPAIAALVTAAIIAGRRGVGDLLRQVSRLRVSPLWYLAALVIPIVLSLLALVLAVPFGETFPAFDFPGIKFLPELLLAIFFDLGEELGWRGFALPRLQGRFNPVVAGLIIGLLWWAWHLPEALAGPASGLSLQQDISREIRDLVQDLAISILMTWIYNGTGKSVFLATLFHISTSLLAQFLVLPHTFNITPSDILFSVLLWIAAAAVILLTRPTPLAYKISETSGAAAPFANNPSDTVIGGVNNN